MTKEEYTLYCSASVLGAMVNKSEYVFTDTEKICDTSYLMAAEMANVMERKGYFVKEKAPEENKKITI